MAKEKSKETDFFDIFVAYLQSKMIFDLIPTIPNVFGGLDPKFAFLKIARIHDVESLYHIFKIAIQVKFRAQPKSISDNIIYAVSTFCIIILILHYLSCLWLYIGSEAFLDYEQGQLPWQFANEDFEGFTLT